MSTRSVLLTSISAHKELQSSYIFKILCYIRHILDKFDVLTENNLMNLRERKSKYMNKELNRLEYMILQSLYRNNCNDSYNGMTIAEIMEDNDNVLGVRMTVWRKMKKLVETGYVAKGILDDHSDTFYLLENGMKLFERKGENEK